MVTMYDLSVINSDELILENSTHYRRKRDNLVFYRDWLLFTGRGLKNRRGAQIKF